MAEKKSPVISFKDFSFQYRAQKKPTLTGINLDIYPGEKVLIAGPSGSGKSTLAGCINGLNPFSNPGECKGTLTVDGVDAPHSAQYCAHRKPDDRISSRNARPKRRNRRGQVHSGGQHQFGAGRACRPQPDPLRL